MKISLDTNILLDTPNIIFDKEKEFAISFTVIRELDKLKRNVDLKYSAQQAIRNIWKQFELGEVDILNVPKTLDDSPDERIIEDTKQAKAKLLSDDIGARIIAKAHGIPISNFEAEDEIDYNYKGYKKVKGDLNYEQDMAQIKELMCEEVVDKFDVALNENEYLIVERVIDKYDIWVKKGNKVSRISQSMKPFKDAGVMTTPMDAEQMCALHAIFDVETPLTVITGKLGSGKTLLSLMGALACNNGQNRFRFYDKIYVTRPPISINKQYQLGFLPGSLEEKLSGFLGGITSNLKFLLEHTEKDKELEIANKVFNDNFEMINLDSIQGTSLHHSILLVDEFQLMDNDMLKLVLSRISEGSKIILIGDTDSQTYGVNKNREGFKVLYKHLGKAKEMSFVKLENIYRSKLAKFVEAIFE